MRDVIKIRRRIDICDRCLVDINVLLSQIHCEWPGQLVCLAKTDKLEDVMSIFLMVLLSIQQAEILSGEEMIFAEFNK